MANSFWNFVTQLVPNNLAKAEDVNTNLAGISAGLDLVEAQTVSSIKVTNTPGVINISATPANRANKIISFDGAGDVLATIFIGNYRNNHVAVAGTVYNVRDTVKDSTGAIGQDNIYICNTTHTSTGTLAVDVANWDILVDAAAVAVSAAAALVSENNAAATALAYDKRELGSKTADPTLDNQGAALADGAQYFNTTLNRKKIYDLGTTTWLLTTANAVDINITDVGTLYTATEVEAALQEVMVVANSGAIDNPPVTSGTATDYVATLGISSYTTGVIYKVRIHILSTGSATINFDNIGVTTINYNVLNSAGVLGKVLLIPGQLGLNAIAELYYDGTNFILLNPSPSYTTFLPELWDNGNVDKGATYTVRNGRAIIDNGNVDIYVRVKPLAFGTLTTSDSLKIGLPDILYSANTNIIPAGIHIVGASSLSMTAGDSLTARMFLSAGKLYIEVKKWTSTGGFAVFTIAELNTGIIEFHGSYRK